MVITTAYYKARNVKVNKAKSPYFTSVARNGHLTNNTEADGALILPPLSISAPFNGYLKLIKAHGKERSRKKDLRSHLGIELRGTLRTEGSTLTNCANPSSSRNVLNNEKKCGLLERIGLLQTFSLKLEPLSLGSVSITHISGLFTHHWHKPWHRLVLDLQLLQKLPLGL